MKKKSFLTARELGHFKSPPHWRETCNSSMSIRQKNAHWVCEGISQANMLEVCHSLLHKYEVSSCEVALGVRNFSFGTGSNHAGWMSTLCRW